MDSNDEYFHLQQELMGKRTDPVEYSIDAIFNTDHSNNNITTMSSNDLIGTTFYIDQVSLFAAAPVNIPTTRNMTTTMIPTPSLLIPTTNSAPLYNASFPRPPPPQNPVMQSSSPPENPAIWSSPWIQNQDDMSSSSMQNNPAMLPSPNVVQPPPPNRDDISAYSSDQVMPSTDVERVYRCNVCATGFTNARALGGHMGRHRNRGEGSSKAKGANTKKTRRR